MHQLFHSFIRSKFIFEVAFMKKQKVFWKIIFRCTDPLFDDNDEIYAADTFIDTDIISTNSFKPEKALKKAKLYCDENNYELIDVAYHSFNKQVGIQKRILQY